MSVRVFEIAQPGMLTTVQDLGRLGYQRLGVPVAGAMDHFSLRVGNRLVGNPENEASLEATFMGPTLKVLANAVIAVTGGDLGAILNSAPLPMWQGVSVSKGDTISFQGPQSGFRAYLCVAGGIDISPVMGSKSTYLRSKIGGYQGRPLQQGDVLEIGQPSEEPNIGRQLVSDLIPSYGGDVALRVVLGPQDDQFTEQGIQTFFSSEFIVTPQMDRMGIRLEGPNIRHREKADIISDGIMFGSVQIPGNEQPIIMMADHQTTGGYTKIATIVSVDVPKMAQAQPGDKVKFQEISIEEAHDLYRNQEERLVNAISEPIAEPSPPPTEAAPAPAAVQKTERPVEAEQGVIIVEHHGRRHVITSEDDVYLVKTFGRTRPKRYRITIEGVPYEVEIR